MLPALFGGKPVRSEFIPYGKQYIDEEDVLAVNEVLTSPYLTTGPKVSKFEADLCELTGAKYAVALANGTAALHAACYAAGITKGDEVITTPITFAASANCILYMGATPVFADVNKDTWNIDPKSIEEKITPKTKAVIAVDFTGQVVEVEKIRDICKRHKLVFIEDAAHSIGSKYNDIPVGNLADLTTFSFHPVKTITCGEGGAILTNNEDYYKSMVLFRTHGITREKDLLTENPYNGYNEQLDLGFNYRMTDFQAALGISQLRKLPEFSKRRKEIVTRYDEAFKDVKGLIVQKEIKQSDTTRHLYIIRLDNLYLKANRNEIYKALNAERVGLQVHYMPVYYHPYYEKLGYKKGICKEAESLYEDIITIPLYYSLSDEDVESVIAAVKKIIGYYQI